MILLNHSDNIYLCMVKREASDSLYNKNIGLTTHPPLTQTPTPLPPLHGLITCIVYLTAPGEIKNVQVPYGVYTHPPF